MSAMPQPPVNPANAVARHVDVEVRREAYTMALYVSICLLAALSLVAERADASHVDVFKLTWGTTVGLAVAHWFAFRVSARLVAGGALGRLEVELAAAQLVGALAVAVLVTVPVLLLPATADLDVARLCLAGFVGAVGFAVARTSGASTRRSLFYASSVLVAALAIAVLKNVLSGH
jgi:hypothetical protein